MDSQGDLKQSIITDRGELFKKNPAGISCCSEILEFSRLDRWLDWGQWGGHCWLWCVLANEAVYKSIWCWKDRWGICDSILKKSANCPDDMETKKTVGERWRSQNDGWNSFQEIFKTLGYISQIPHYADQDHYTDQVNFIQTCMDAPSVERIVIPGTRFLLMSHYVVWFTKAEGWYPQWDSRKLCGIS